MLARHVGFPWIHPLLGAILARWQGHQEEDGVKPTSPRDRIDPNVVLGSPSPTLGRTACPAVTESSRALCLRRRNQPSAVAASVLRTGPPPVAQVALTPPPTRPLYLGDVRAVGEAVPVAPSTDRPLGVLPRSQAPVRGTGCVHRARPGLRTPGAINSLGPLG